MYWNKPYKTSAYTKIGVFKVKNIDKYKNIYTYTCYDYVNKFDTIVDTWYNGLTYPINLGTMFSTLCTAVGVTGDSNFDAYPAVVDAKKFNATNLNGKTILHWISQIAGGYCYADPDGVIRIRHYATSGSVASLTNNDYVKLNIANFTVPAPNWLRIVTDPSGAYTDQKNGDNLIKISGNPLCYNCTSTVTYAKNLLGWMVSYVPFTIQLLDDKGIKAGDRITINGTQTLVMEKKIQPSGVVLTTNGQEVRQENTELYQESIDLTGYLKQYDYDHTISNSSGTYTTAGLSLKGQQTVGGVVYDMTTSVNYKGINANANAGVANYAEAGISTNGVLPRLIVSRTTPTYGSTASLTERMLSIYENSGMIEMDCDYGLVLGTTNYVTATVPMRAEDSWWTVGSSNTSGEPTSYSTLPSTIQFPRAIKYFVLALTNSDGTRIYSSTTIPSYGYGTSRTTFAHTEYLPQTGAQGTYTAYRGYCDINFENMSYKLWVSSASYYARLYCFY